MKRLMPASFFFVLSSAPGLSVPLFSRHSPQPGAEKPIEVNITIFYDNNWFDPSLKTAWGFSCLVRGLKRTVLFDTGGNGSTLLGNMMRLGIEPAEVDIVVLSHIHVDHTGGLGKFLEKNSRAVVYLPGSFPVNFKKAVMSLGASVEEVLGPRELFPGAYTIGELGDEIREQALALKTAAGLVVITGCAHPGIMKMVRKAREITGEETVCMLVGGFHLGGELPSRIQSIAEELRPLSVQKVAPCHCSGDGTRGLFREKFREDYVESGAGKSIRLPSP
jgi:7,8-dihydropterin-6-yl-methyl-4-(beta-D-ribofuranosyl)aminobenzene 5'-phosphate synthase